MNRWYGNRLLAFVCCAIGTVCLPLAAQQVLTTVPVGQSPNALAVNSVTNKIYVADLSGSSVTVIDGATDTTRNISIAPGPVAIALNASTNMVFASNLSSAGTVSVINGATGQFVKTVTVGNDPQAIAANPVSNKIYVANVSDGTVSVIDGATLEATNTVIVGTTPYAIAINQVTNKIYVTEEETEISYKRRILHGKIDILRAELVNRLRSQHNGGQITITGDDVQRLTDILTQHPPESPE